MDIYGWDGVESALHAYTEAVAGALKIRPEYTCCSMDSPASAYIALEERLPEFSDRDLAMIWDERFGWAVANESSCGEELITVSYLGIDQVPAPDRVVAFLESVLSGADPGVNDPPDFAQGVDLGEKLRAAMLPRVGTDAQPLHRMRRRQSLSTTA